MEKNKAIQSIMKDLDCTEAEAEEVFAMEEKARKNGVKNYVPSEKVKERKSTRERKADPDKQFLITVLANHLPVTGTIVNPEREIEFTFNGNSYSVTLTKHRPKKS